MNACRKRCRRHTCKRSALPPSVPFSYCFSIHLPLACFGIMGFLELKDVLVLVSNKVMAVSLAKTFSLPIMNIVRTTAVPIIQQLHLEERLLRTSSDNWCIINDGTDTSTIVMGVSGKPSELIELESVLRDRIPVLRRFSGGGTVIVDKGTVFVTFICNKGAIPGLQPYPLPIMTWTGQLYGKVLQGIGNFSLRENGWYKLSFISSSTHLSLWRYPRANSSYFYQARNHLDFLCPMKKYMASSSEFIERTVASIQDHFSLKPVQFDVIANSSEAATHTPSTRQLTEEELEAAMASSIGEQTLAAA
ncbi:hypothetical protein Taro_022402 [Colocasia esculenta]|uniref:BPL/LPL catalytic domain-containing protein n=1 Tax=Colocasia esculenta TaxID=4460 RepID=A0A843VED3_COLES|nr:hypothetical protein [Colocasia esculenta]